MVEFNKICPFNDLYPPLDKAYHECSNGYVNGSCLTFIKTLAKLLPEYDCQRSFDKTYIVPAVWLAGAASEDFYELLYDLASGKKKMYSGDWYQSARGQAKKLFLSKEFKSVLDGSMAEEYFPLIKAMENGNP